MRILDELESAIFGQHAAFESTRQSRWQTHGGTQEGVATHQHRRTANVTGRNRKDDTGMTMDADDRQRAVPGRAIFAFPCLAGRPDPRLA